MEKGTKWRERADCEADYKWNCVVDGDPKRGKDENSYERKPNQELKEIHREHHEAFPRQTHPPPVPVGLTIENGRLI